MDRKPKKPSTSSSRMLVQPFKPVASSVNKPVSLRTALNSSVSSHNIGLRAAISTSFKQKTSTGKGTSTVGRSNASMETTLASSSMVNTSGVSRKGTRMSLGSTVKVRVRLGRHSDLSCAGEKQPLPLSAVEAVTQYRDELTPYELTEILSYDPIYYLGRLTSKLPDCNYDTEKGDYIPVLGDHLAYRYEIKGILGKGSFGIVLCCFDHKHKAPVAVKIIKNKKLFHQQGLVEVRVLQLLRERDRDGTVPVISLKLHFMFRRHLCLVFELLANSLYDYMKTNHFQPVDSSFILKVTVQLLKSLIFIKKLRIIHCDIKPENILFRVEGKSGLKLIDFGSACFENAKVYSYIQSRYYRAPEVILGNGYNAGIDMWSLGCILVELVKGTPAFPGESEKHQLALYMEVLGRPPSVLIGKSPKRHLYFEQNGDPKPVQTSKGRPILPGSTSLDVLLLNTPAEFKDFVSRCLDWNPFTRIAPEDALRHPWLQSDVSLCSLKSHHPSVSLSHSRTVSLLLV